MKKVLIIDDDSDFRRLTGEILRPHGWQQAPQNRDRSNEASHSAGLSTVVYFSILTSLSRTGSEE